MVMSISTGFVARGFEPVREAFEKNFEDDLELGAGFAAYVGSRKVVDLVGGFMDRAKTRPWTEDTLCPVYSTTKPTAALVVALLADRGHVDYDAPLADYWPEFGANGKGDFTVAEVLSHRAACRVLPMLLTRTSGSILQPPPPPSPRWPRCGNPERGPATIR